MLSNAWNMEIFQRLLRFAFPIALIACNQVGGIDDPHPKDGSGGEASGSSSSSSSSGDLLAWADWPMPNPQSTGLPNPASYAVNAADDVVTDNVTGLMWQRTVVSGTFIWTDAKAYCENLNQGEHADWRLPSRIELISIVDFSTTFAIDNTVFLNTSSANFWTSSPVSGFPNLVWVVFLGYGNTDQTGIMNMGRVVCVR